MTEEQFQELRNGLKWLIINSRTWMVQADCTRDQVAEQLRQIEETAERILKTGSEYRR